MPWTPDDGPARHDKKADTPKKKRQWADVANSVLARTGDEAQAVRTANGVIAKHEFSAEEEKAQREARRARARYHRGSRRRG